MPKDNYDARFGNRITELIKDSRLTTRDLMRRIRNAADAFGEGKPAVYSLQLKLLQQGWLPRNTAVVRCLALALGEDPDGLVREVEYYRAAKAVERVTRAYDGSDILLLIAALSREPRPTEP